MNATAKRFHYDYLMIADFDARRQHRNVTAE